MEKVWHTPLPLLLLTGGLLGATFPLGKIAAGAGVSPIIWAFVIASGSGMILAATVLATGRRLPLDRASLIYYMVTAAISYAVPNILLFSVIPRLGAGYSGIMFTLSPVLTLLLSLLMRIVQPSRLGVGGIAAGFIGALMIALSRLASDSHGDVIWVALAFLIPLSLACGNVYRTMAWPEHANPLALAAGSNLAAAALLFMAALIVHRDFPVQPLTAMPGLAMLQLAASALMFTFFFQLQAVGGPVYLSQIGYVAAAIGVVTGMILFQETHGGLTWAGAGLIGTGIAMTTLAQRQKSA